MFGLKFATSEMEAEFVRLLRKSKGAVAVWSDGSITWFGNVTKCDLRAQDIGENPSIYLCMPTSYTVGAAKYADACRTQRERAA